jgi:HemY protein
MRGLFWILALFATAVGLSLAARYNDGYVLIFVNPKRIEFSLTLFVLLTVLAFFLFYFFIRAAAYTLGLPERVKAFRAERARAKARHSLFDALLSSFEGRYARAAKSAASAHAAGEEPGLAALLAARAEHRMEHFGTRDEWLQRAAAAAAESGDATLNHARLMTAAELLADQRRDTEALAVLAELNQSGARHIATQRLA